MCYVTFPYMYFTERTIPPETTTNPKLNYLPGFMKNELGEKACCQSERDVGRDLLLGRKCCEIVPCKLYVHTASWVKHCFPAQVHDEVGFQWHCISFPSSDISHIFWYLYIPFSHPEFCIVFPLKNFKCNYDLLTTTYMKHDAQSFSTFWYF